MGEAQRVAGLREGEERCLGIVRLRSLQLEQREGAFFFFL